MRQRSCFSFSYGQGTRKERQIKEVGRFESNCASHMASWNPQRKIDKNLNIVLGIFWAVLKYAKVHKYVSDWEYQ